MKGLMSEIAKQSSCNNFDDNEYDEEDDFISFQYENQTINLYYSHLSKYSRLIRKEYLFSDVQNRLPQDLRTFQERSNINPETIHLFFQLLQNDFTINENSNFTFKQYADFYQISEFLQIKKFMRKITECIKSHKFETDFAIQIIQYENEKSTNIESQQFQINQEMEEVLSTKINECLQNEKFAQIPVPSVHRIIEKCDMKVLSADLLFDFIMKDLDRFHILFSFLKIQNLSEDRIRSLHECFLNDENKRFFVHLGCNLDYIMKLRAAEKNVRENLRETEEEKNRIKRRLDESEDENKRIKNEIVELQKRLNESEQTRGQFEQEISQLRSQLGDSDKEKDLIQKKLIESEKEKAHLQKRVGEMENEINEIKEELKKERCQVTGQIEAKIRSGLIFYAEIHLIENGATLDKERSKYIVSSSNAKELGWPAYESGEPISSLDLTTVDFAGSRGTRYVRAFVVGSNGLSCELISNPVTTSGTCLPFDYEGMAREVVLARGKYLLEAWGGEGGSSAGSKRYPAPLGHGGKGGYSKGTLSLAQSTKLFIYVGGCGRSGDSTNGSTANGGFPDGGGTQTHHGVGCTTVPGTGGGSSSIRISTDSLYARVIVAGGGGGADADGQCTNHGGFGGGTSGGCEGAGTQTGSSPGARQGKAGTFGQGAGGLFRSGCNSGGAGGGGWYGGGGGGHGRDCNCGSGGGGSGWVFTEASFLVWKSGDSTNASKFLLGRDFYLTDASTIQGNSLFPHPSGRNSETGHSGNGHVKITPVRSQ